MTATPKRIEDSDKVYFLYCDETNLNPDEADFFVYGGIAIPGDRAKELSDSIERIRSEANVPAEFLLKFNPGPGNLDHSAFIQVKEKVIRAAVDCECVLIVSMILHNIATSPDDARRNAINTVLYHFNCYLNRPDTHGLVLIDRFSDQQIDSHLRQRFAVGVTGLPFSPVMRLDRIVGFHYSTIGQSHFGSIIDIVLGSLRLAINAYSQEPTGNLETPKLILRIMEPLFHRDSFTDEVHNISLNFSPNIVRVPEYREKYNGLRAFLSEAGINAAQRII